MRRLSLVAVLVCAASLLAACQGTLPGNTSGDVTPNAVTGDPIEVMSLDSPTEGASPPDAATAESEMPDPAAVRASGAETAEPQVAASAPSEEAEPVPAVEPLPEPAPKPDLTATPPAPKSERQLACEKKRGRWVNVGNAGFQACVYDTKDAGKQCDRESQCESVCLARSRTCAPFKPVYGCNEILQDNGARVTLCID